MANWFREGEWLPIASLAPSYAEPVVLTDETKTIQWLSERPSKAAVEHREHQCAEDGVTYLYDGAEPVMKSRTVKPAFWALARMVD
jgi:hypothetical protein